MNVTSVIETPFQVNLDSVVYAYARGDGSSIMLSKGSVILDVAETVAELITESAGGLVAFTAVSGDATGDIAVNPNYILTVESANGGSYSTLKLCDNIYTRATITVDTAYSEMDAIVETSSGGSSYSVYTALLSQSGTDAPVATVLQNTLGGTLTWSRLSEGVYRADLTAYADDAEKILVLHGSVSSGAIAMLAYIEYPYVIVETQVRADGSGSDEQLYNSSIEIRVYP